MTMIKMKKSRKLKVIVYYSDYRGNRIRMRDIIMIVLYTVVIIFIRILIVFLMILINRNMSNISFNNLY